MAQITGYDTNAESSQTALASATLVDTGSKTGVHTTGLPISDTPEAFEDTSFVVGDSPATLDCNAALGRNATQGYIVCDGAGDIKVSFSTDGVAFGDDFTLKKDEKMEFVDVDVDSIRITHVTNSAYRVLVV